MDVKTLLGLAAAVGAGVLAHQDPSFEYPGVKPVLTTSPVGGAEVADSTLQKTISVRFKNASADDVFDWLSNQGISFVTTEVPKDIKINLNLKDVPLGDAVEAIGEAMGGGWSRQGGVFVFHFGIQRNAFKVVTSDFPVTKPVISEFRDFGGMNDPAQAKKWKDYAEKMQKQFGDGSPFQKQMEKQFSENSGYAKQMEKQFSENSGYAKQMEKQFGENSEYAKKMQKQFGEGSPFQKQMEKQFGENSEYAKKIQKQFGPNSAFSKQQAKQWEQFGTDMQKQFGPGSSFEKSMKFDKGVFDLSMKNQDKALAELDKIMKSKDMDMKAFEFHMKDMDKVMQSGAFKHDFTFFQGQDFAGIAKSLTPAQRAKNKQQGFLNYSDLTTEQKRMLGIKSDGAWTVTYSRDGESFTIKSDPKSK